MNCQSDKHLIGYIHAKNEIFTLTIVSTITSKKCDKIENFNFDGFPDSLPEKLKSSMKCLILKIKEFTSNGGFSENLIYRQNLDAKLKYFGTPYYFIDSTVLTYTSPMVATELDIKTNEIVVTINIVNETHLIIRKFVRKSDGYEFIGNPTKIPYDINNDYDKIFNAVIDSAANPPIHIIGLMNVSTIKGTEYLNFMKTHIFKECTFSVIKSPFAYYFSKIIIEIGKFICNPLNNRYHIKPISQCVISLKTPLNEVTWIEPIILIQTNQILPFQKSAIIKRTAKIFYSYSTTTDDHKLITEIKPSKNCHQIKFTLKIDVNHVVQVTQESIFLFGTLPLKKDLSKLIPSKIPIIVFFENILFICVWNKESEKYAYLKSWNGIYGKDIYLSFKKEKPKIVDDSDLSEHVVHDLLQIMSMPQNCIIDNPVWKFKITKNSDHPVLIEIKDHEGNRKAAYPTFMMALILKQHIKVIKNEIGEKSKEIGIKFFAQKSFTKKERRRIRGGLEEACKKLNIVFHSID